MLVETVSIHTKGVAVLVRSGKFKHGSTPMLVSQLANALHQQLFPCLKDRYFGFVTAALGC